MKRLVERCAGLDVHRDTVAACARVPGEGGERRQEVHTFRTTTRQLLALKDWLRSKGVTLVGMESTGIYWRPIFYLLEDEVECWLPGAQHLHHVPGRKTDVADAVWICELVAHGLVRPWVVPPSPIRELRNLTRYRTAVIEERGRETQRLHKTLEDAGTRAVQRGLQGADRLGPGHARGAGGGPTRPRGAGRAGPWAHAPQAPAAPRGAAGAASAPIMRCWCRRCWSASTTPTRRSRSCRPRSTG